MTDEYKIGDDDMIINVYPYGYTDDPNWFFSLIGPRESELDSVTRHEKIKELCRGIVNSLETQGVDICLTEFRLNGKLLNIYNNEDEPAPVVPLL